MPIALPTEVEKVVQDKVDSGAYASADDVLRAAFVALQHQETFGDFAPGEWNDLPAEGKASIAADGVLDGGAALDVRRDRRVASGGEILLKSRVEGVGW